jgi:hypothetical protein
MADLAPGRIVDAVLVALGVSGENADGSAAL